MAPLQTAEGVRRLFRIGLSIVWMLAFASLAWQVDGLMGPEGLMPVEASREALSAHLPSPSDAMLTTPSLLWILPAGWGPWLLCMLGLVAGGVMASGRWAAPANLVCWIAFRSLMPFGGPFLSYQWDALLLETGLVALLVLPWRATPTRQAPTLGWWALRLVLFRVVFFSGVVKLTSGDPSWRDLSALSYHHWTQPLPNAAGWLAAQLPWPVHSLSTLVMFVIELPLALALLGPRQARSWAGLGVALLMLTLALTGSYGFFQLLVLVLCLSLLDDDHLVAAGLDRLRPAHVPAVADRAREGLAGIGLAVVLAASVIVGLPRYAGVSLPESFAPASRTFRQLDLGHTYGLFAVMTTTRPIPVLEARWGDGPWSEVRWAWQTSDPTMRPAQVAPHMPRLDWQVWFAGLGRCEHNPWIVRMMDRLIAGSEPVALLVGDPRLRTRAPDALRLVTYTYEPTPLDAPEAWWTRTRQGPYCPGIRTASGWVAAE